MTTTTTTQLTIGQIRAGLETHARDARASARIDLPLAPMQLFKGGAGVLVPLVERADGLHVLLTKRSSLLRSHAGEVSFPGGKADEGECAESGQCRCRSAPLATRQRTLGALFFL